MQTQVPFPLSLVLTPKCFDVFFLHQDFLHAECLKQTLSKLSGYGIVAASSLLKLPIVLNILKAGSTTGLSESSILIETSVFISSFSQAIIKGHPFSTWGELVMISIQNLIILTLMAFYNKSSVLRSLLVLGLIVGFAAMCLQVPKEFANFLVYYSMMAAVASRVPQILSNFRNGHTGVLSPITVCLQLVGVSVRLVTVLVETKDMASVSAYLLSLSLNGVILLQVFWYRQATRKVLGAKEQKKKQ
jgi:mannose-P-dolichol utilization defect protein 1